MITTDVKNIILRAVSEARDSGRDYTGQLQAAVKAVFMVRPDISTLDIMSLINQIV